MNQMEYFEILVRQLREPENVEQAMAWAGAATREQISEQIDRLKAEKSGANPPMHSRGVTPPEPCVHGPFASCGNCGGQGYKTPADLEVGMYRKADGRMFRVYPARNRGHLLTKELVQAEYDVTKVSDQEQEVVTDWRFEYRGAASRFVSANERMTLKEAKQFGHDFGVCCCCGALLTDPDSVARGIGPWCAKKV